jgi:hypothetical protein
MAARKTKKTPPAKATTKKAAPRPAKRAKVAKKAAARPAKKSATARPAKKSATATATRVVVETDGLLDAALFPTARAYAEEELHILSVARAHPKLGDRFIRDATRRVETKIPKKDRPAFLAAMSKVDIEARAEIVVAKMAEYWGVNLDEETKENVREDVRAMYAGD